MKTIRMADFQALYGPDTVVIDVRESAEYVDGHVPGAIHIPLSQVASRVAEVPEGDPVYVICRSGNRSKVGASVLAANGRNAISVDGGTVAWQVSRKPVVTGPDPH